MFGFYRVASAVNKTIVGNPSKNAEEIITLIKEAYTKEVSVIVFPELTLTGYTASDLLMNQTLIDSQNESLLYILKNIENINSIAIIGLAVFEPIDSTTVQQSSKMEKYLVLYPNHTSLTKKSSTKNVNLPRVVILLEVR